MPLPHRRRSSTAQKGVVREAERKKDDGCSPLESDVVIEKDAQDGALESPAEGMKFLHRVRAQSSILALAVDEQCVFAGLQGGKIQVDTNLFGLVKLLD